MARTKSSTLQVQFVVDGEGQVKAVFNGVAGDADKSSKAIDNLSKEMLTLTERLDKAAAKSNQLARDRSVLDEALKRGLITQERHNELLGKSVARYDELAAKAKIAGAVIGTALVAGLVLVARETIQTEQQQAQLAAVLKSTGEAAGLTQRQLNAMADELAKSSIFSAGDITEAQTRLLSYTGIVGENIPRAMQIVIDQSARLGISLTQSAETIGRALESPTKAAAALAQQGFGAAFTQSVRDAIQALEDSGREAEAQAIVMGILEESYEGAAVAARDTLGGAAVALKNSFLDLLTGDSGSDGVRGTTEAINDLTDTMNDPDVKAGFQTIITGIADLTAWALKGITALGGLGEAARQALASDGDKSYMGLLAKRAAIEDDLGLVDQGVLGRARLVLGGNSGEASPIVGRADLEASLADIDRLINARREERRLAAMPAPMIITADNGQIPDSALRTARPAATKNKTEAELRKEAAEARRIAREAAREREAALRELQAQIEAVVVAQEAFTTRAEDLRAEIEGPLAQAQLAYDRELERFRDLAKQGEIGATELAAAERDLAEQHGRTAAAIRQRLDPASQMIKDMEFELSLLTMTNAQRSTALQLRQLEGQATPAQAAALMALNEQYDEEMKNIAFLDDFRDGLSELGLTAVNNFGKVDDAFKNMMDSLAQQVQRRILEGWLDAIFGERGSNGQGTSGGNVIGGLLSTIFGGGGGNNTGLSEEQMYAKSVSPGGLTGSDSGGGWSAALSGLMGMIFGGGRASGGDTQAHHFYRVNEIRPELLDWNGQTYLMMGSQGGRVRPMEQAQAGGNTYNINVPVTGQVDRRTRSQIGAETARAIRRDQGRNG